MDAGSPGRDPSLPLQVGAPRDVAAPGAGRIVGAVREHGACLQGMTRRIFHVDLDEFIAAVEVLRHPELEGKPVVVGGDGDPTKRGVVSTANYVAREYGIRSAMPLRTALKRCPQAVFLPVDSEAYLAASREVMDVLRSFEAAVVRVLGWDEAFMGVEASEPEVLAREVQARVFERTRLWCSIG